MGDGRREKGGKETCSLIRSRSCCLLFTGDNGVGYFTAIPHFAWPSSLEVRAKTGKFKKADIPHNEDTGKNFSFWVSTTRGESSEMRYLADFTIDMGLDWIGFTGRLACLYFWVAIILSTASYLSSFPPVPPLLAMQGLREEGGIERERERERWTKASLLHQILVYTLGELTYLPTTVEALFIPITMRIPFSLYYLTSLSCCQWRIIVYPRSNTQP